ncbi:hypothetical protein [Chitinimonas sp. JJ19]|uniref:hypothetical protein n=1 Tax=Chitinimonas sp. JJ19 TaxID=3109352 RepID=UPI0030028B1E
MHAHAKTWVYLALVYFLVAIFLGVQMGVSQDYALRSVHAHVHLLGWVSLTLTGLVYHFFPHAGQSRMAHVHFWLYNSGTPLMLVALALFARGQGAAQPVIAIGSVMVLLAVVLFVFNVLRHRG